MKTASVLCKRAKETLPQFIARLPPSRTAGADIGCDWIGVDTTLEMEGSEGWKPFSVGSTVEAEFAKYCSRERMAADDDRQKKLITMTGLSKAVFEGNGAVEGRWLVNVERDQVDTIWEAVCEALYDDRLGDKAQVTPAHANSDMHCIAIHTSDYSDLKRQEKIVKVIRSINIDEKLLLKPCAATALGLYPGEAPWGDRATTLYACLEHQSTILQLEEYTKRRSMMFGFRKCISDAL